MIIELHQSDYAEIIDVWEASVRASHHFLTEADIQYFKPLILNNYLQAIGLYGIRTGSGELSAFLGFAQGKIEMLFVRPEDFGKGLGKTLVNFAVSALNATRVDVNEDNPGAYAFYKKMGFSLQQRSPLDSSGRPFPILSLERL